MAGKRSQRKGRTAELELTRILNENGIPARPGNPVSFGSTPDITNVAGIHIECKRSEKVHLTAWMEQATEDSRKFGGMPCVFSRRDREGWIVSMQLADWIQLYESWQEKTKNDG